MSRRHKLVAVAVAVVLAVAALWYLRLAPTDVKLAILPVAPKPAIAAPLPNAEATPSPGVAVNAPASGSVSGSSTRAVTTVTPGAPKMDPDLSSAVSGLITAMETQDVHSFVKSYLAPAMLDTSRAAMIRRLPADATPEAKAQIDQSLQTQLPQIIQQTDAQMDQHPHALLDLQNLGGALSRALANPPVMNDAGDQATFTLDTETARGGPATVTLVRRDGNWVMDARTVARLIGGK